MINWFRNIFEAQDSAMQIKFLSNDLDRIEKDLIDRGIENKQLRDHVHVLEQELQHAMDTVEEVSVLAKHKARIVSIDHTGEPDRYMGKGSKYWYDKLINFKIKVVAILQGDMTNGANKVAMIQCIVDDEEESNLIYTCEYCSHIMTIEERTGGSKYCDKHKHIEKRLKNKK